MMQSDYLKQVILSEKIIGENNKQKYLSFKELVADRSPKELGIKIKTSEIIYHHEITNQVLWNNF